MDIDRIWGLSLASVMFLATTFVQCQNQTVTEAPSANRNSTTHSEEIIPGTLKLGSDNMFEAPQLFGSQPFSIKTNPVTGEVDFQTKTTNVQAINEARDREEAMKVAELQEDIKSRVPSSAHLPLEARDEEYEDYEEPIKRADTEYYEDEPMEAREPIMVANKESNPRPSPPKEEDSFFSIFESLFGGGEEEKPQETPKPPPQANSPPYREPLFTTTTTFIPEIRTPHRPTEAASTTWRPPDTTSQIRTTTENRRVFQQYPERQSPYLYNNEMQPPSQQFMGSRPGPPPARPSMYQQIPENSDRVNFNNQPNKFATQAPFTSSFRPPALPQEQYYHQQQYQERPVGYPKPQERPYSSQYIETSKAPTSTSTSTTTSTTSTTTSTTQPPKPIQSEWQSVDSNFLSQNYPKESIDRQDTIQNEVTPLTNQQSNPDYYNFINLPVHYSTKDTAIPLISGSYANTKIQGMGASKHEKNSGKYSNHKYEQQATSKRPSYWSTKRPATNQPVQSADFDFETDDGAIGFSADFGGYGQKEGVKPATEKTAPQPTSTRATSTTFIPTTTTVQTTTRFTPPRTTPTQPAPVREYDEYDYESYPAQVKPIQNPMLFVTTPQPITPAQTSSTSSTPKSTIPPPKEQPEYEYYDYDAEPTTTTVRSTTTSTTTTTTQRPTTSSTTTTVKPTTTSRYKVRYPSLQKDKIRRPEEKVEVVVPVKVEQTTQTQYVSRNPQRQTTTTLKPIQIFDDPKVAPSNNAPQTSKLDNSIKQNIGTSENDRENNANIELMPDNDQEQNKQPFGDYTTEFTMGIVHGQGDHSSNNHQQQEHPHHHHQHPAVQQQEHGSHLGNGGHFIASSIAASPFDGPDEPFRPIPRPAGMSASFQVSGEQPQFPQSAPDQDVHEPHEFIPSPQFHRPENDLFVVGTSFNTKPGSKPNKLLVPQEPYQPPTRKNEIISVKPKPQLPGLYPPSDGDYYTPDQKLPFYGSQKPDFQERPGIVKDEEYYRPTNKPNYPTAKPVKEDEYGLFLQNKQKGQTNVEIAVDYDFDGIQTEPKPGQYVIFPKPQINSEINENQQKGSNVSPQNFPEKPVTEPIREQEMSTMQPPQPEKNFEKPEVEKQQEMASSYPRPHWEKNGKPSFLLNQNQNNRPPPFPPQMSSNLIPPGNVPTRFRRPVTPSNLPPIRKNYNEGGSTGFPLKPKPNLPNILPQFRPNAKIGSAQRPYRGGPPNRRKENFPYRIQNEPDQLMHRDFEVDDEIGPKFITHRNKYQDRDQYVMQKRLGLPSQPVTLKRQERAPVTTLQMLQQNQNVKKQPSPTTREDHVDASVPLLPPLYKPYKDDEEKEKDVYLVYPMKTPFNSNIKIEDPDKIDYSFNQTHDQVPLLKPSKKKEKPKPDFPYGFVTPEENMEKLKKDPKFDSQGEELNPDLMEYLPKGPKGSQDVEPNLQDYMPSGARIQSNKRERIDMNLHMQSNNQWNQVSTNEEPALITIRKEGTVVPKNNPPTQYHTIMKNTNASEFTLGAIMHTLTDKNKRGGGGNEASSISISEDNSALVRPGLNVNERISNGKIVTVSMPLDVKQERESTSGFEAPFQASSTVQTGQGWNILEQEADNATQSTNTTKFDFENFKPELIGGFKPIYNSPEEEEDPSLLLKRTKTR